MSPDGSPDRTERARVIAALTTALQSRGIDTTRLDEVQGTMGASDRRLASGGLVSEPGETFLDRLRAEPVELRALLGAGGMGEVHLAHQPSLHREIAVKIATSKSHEAEASLLKEALVGAHVEHPNVVPVHTLARVRAQDREGPPPGLFMKRIEGRPWQRLLADSSLAAEHVARAGAEDALALHVQILIRVCNAVAFAHSRGVVHLDLKPDNVMVGAHGEVYVLDWGLAAGLEGAPAWLGRAHDIRRIAGTPGYMAPELAAADGTQIGEHTDVYLLGAVLHHALTGEPLHRGDTLWEMLGSAFASMPPSYGPEVPAELGAIVVRATHAEPAQRFPSVRALKEALEAFLRHRPAERLLARAEAALAEADGDDDAAIEPRLAEGDIALEEARRIWPEHPRLTQLDRTLARRRLDHAIRRERVEPARRLLARLPGDDDAARRVQELEARLGERDRHLRALEELERDLDLTLGQVSRTRMWIVLGLTWAAVSLAYLGLERAGLFQLSYEALFTQGALMVAFFVPLAFALRHTHLENRAHRRLYGGIAVTGLTVELLFVCGKLLGLPLETALAITPLFYTYAFATLAIVLDRRLVPASLVMAGAGLFAGLGPALSHAWIGLGGLLAVLLTAQAWRRPAPAK